MVLFETDWPPFYNTSLNSFIPNVIYKPIQIYSCKWSLRWCYFRFLLSATLNMMYLAAAFRPDALCTSTTTVTTREAAPLTSFPSGLTGLCLYWMYTSRRPERQQNKSQYSDAHCVFITLHVIMCTRGLRLKSCGTLSPGNQGQGEHLGLVRMLFLHGGHGTEFRQRKQSFGYKLISDVWIIIPAEKHIH